MIAKLGGEAIYEQFSNGNWRAYRNNDIIPMDELDKMIGPNSMDVRLHEKIIIPKKCPGGIVDPYQENNIEYETIMMGDDEGFVLPPNKLVIGAVKERFVCNNPVEIYGQQVLFAPMYEGRSTCARLGLTSHLSAGFGDHFFSGAFTLEILLDAPYNLLLRKGMRIGQIAFESVYKPRVYQGAYSHSNHNDGPVIPKLGRNRF